VVINIIQDEHGSLFYEIEFTPLYGRNFSEAGNTAVKRQSGVYFQNLLRYYTHRRRADLGHSVGKAVSANIKNGAAGAVYYV
jgi:hypothetical protein